MLLPVDTYLGTGLGIIITIFVIIIVYQIIKYLLK